MKKGFTLVETVVAAAVVALIVIFSLAMIPTFKLSNRRANCLLRAGTLAQSDLERLRAAPFETLAGTAFDDVVDDGVTYRRTVEVSNVETAGTPAATVSETVRVVVRWRWSEREYQTFRETILCKVPRG